ncbi:MAG: PD-(D/E)XK nuclease family protein [Spirochaetales bacterium]|nr:PD-(D/E)XK nuclease family protein [Spirochaetales bacterium]
MEYNKAMEMEENNKEYTQLNSVIELVQRYGKEGFSKLDSFLSKDCINYHKEKTRIYKEHDIDNEERFNFFESISDKWYRENFHSDVLYTILNPNTKEIGRKYFMQEFVKFLNIEDRFDCNKNCEVIKEQPTGLIVWEEDGQKIEKPGYIDLFIKNESQAIIIENKINYAPDMENQLVRYMKYVDEELGIKEYTVVYLTLTGDKEPPLDSYSKDFDEYAKKLHDEKILKKVCAVNEKHGLANVFLKNCCKRLEDEMTNTNDPELKKKCNIASVYIDQYKTLLEHLGGRAYMLSTEKKLIEEIYSDGEKLKAAEDFSDLWWYRKQEILNEIFKNRFREKFPDRILPSKENINGLPCYIWKVEDKDYFLYWDGGVYMGFCSQNGKQLSDETQNKLLKQICRIPLREGEYKENTWVYCNIKSDSENPNLFENVMNALEILFNS